MISHMIGISVSIKGLNNIYVLILSKTLSNKNYSTLVTKPTTECWFHDSAIIHVIALGTIAMIAKIAKNFSITDWIR